jgi:hypothetical protein
LFSRSLLDGSCDLAENVNAALRAENIVCHKLTSRLCNFDSDPITKFQFIV